MGIAEQVQEMLHRIGFGSFASQTHVLYPELVRQFLSTVEVHYNSSARLPGQGALTYLCRGVYHEISIPDLCDLYGFDRTVEQCQFPQIAQLRKLEPLWQHIASGPLGSRENKLSLIRHPALRIVAKIIGLTLFGKEEAGALRMDELLLMYLGLPDIVDELFDEEVHFPRMNLGAVFADILVDQKFRVLGRAKTKRTVSVGSLLTPIFRYHGVLFDDTERVEAVAFLDREYMQRSHIMRDGIYGFCPDSDTQVYCRLPKPLWTSLETLECIGFQLPEEELCSASGTGLRRRGGTGRRSHEAAEPARHSRHTRPPQHSAQPQGPTEYLLPPYTGEYDIPPLAPDSSVDAQLAHLRQSSSSIMSMLTRIWGALASIPRPSPPQCCTAPDDVVHSTARASTSAAPAMDDAPVAPPAPRRSTGPGYDSGHETD